ncbi:MAG TPA: tetratricopeptide repeat protein [Bacteroidota bacterium]
MKCGTPILFLLAVLFLAVQPAAGQTPAELFGRGNDDYRAGKYAEAVTQYQEIIGQGLGSAEVYFNLGNAFFRQGNIAQAILSYERAQRLKPGDPDIVHNLRLANFRTIDRIEPVPELFIIEWLRSLAAFVPFQTAVQVLMAAWLVFFVSLAGVYVVRGAALVRFLRWTVLVALLVVLLSGGTMGVHVLLSRDNNQGIVTATIVTAKSSPDEQSVNAFVVHEGLKVKMSDTLGDWVKITLADGKVGWIHADQCERI